jgi:Mn2+/Fe2+ NRAMP family transporter
MSNRKLSLAAIGPGILVAATGVGAGDLATATLTGAHLGTAILWAVLIGAGLKFVLNEGLTRWQLATGTTLLEGTVQHLGKPLQWVFMLYLIVWSYLVAMALMSACGVAAQAMFPFFENPADGKFVFGAIQSLAAWLLVTLGGYSVFEKVMSFCIGLMFVVVCVTALLLRPDMSEMLLGMCVPRIPDFSSGGLGWTIALLGGVGGTVTVLCYGYWIREEGRETLADLPACRLDLGVGYAMTAVFGVAMVIIGSQLGDLGATGAGLIVKVADTLETKMGAMGLVFRWAFLIGAWGAVFSSLLGVWQSVPYLFTDFWALLLRRDSQSVRVKIDTKSVVYRAHLAAIATIPISGLYLFNFSLAMKVNGMVGAVFIPMLAVALLMLNGRAKLIGRASRNSPLTTLLLITTLIVFIIAGGFQIAGTF